jgi:hypothetical protein
LEWARRWTVLDEEETEEERTWRIKRMLTRERMRTTRGGFEDIL